MNWIYRQIPSLQEFLLVDSTVVEMEHYLRLANGDWQIHMIRGLDATLRLESLGISIAVEEIYRNAETLPA